MIRKRTILAYVVIFTALAAVALLYVSSAKAITPIRPEAHPSCHCKAKWDHRPYVYHRIWIASDGTKIYATCVVNPRTGVTLCSVHL